MDIELRRKVEQNIFHKSRLSVEPWERFRWHPSDKACDTWKIRSSQALSIDVFGYLKHAPEKVRTAACNLLAELAGIRKADNWRIELEWRDPCRLLRESGHPTQIDALLESDDSMLFIECKFTENQAGTCSQTRQISKGAHRGMVQCSGSYMMQMNPANGRESHCALTGKGIRYWGNVPKVMKVDPITDYQVCPFKGSRYQWMRNLTTAYAVADHRRKRAALWVVYADANDLSLANEVHSDRWTQLCEMMTGEVPLRAISYQAFLGKIVNSLDEDICREELQELLTWVNNKIDSKEK